jgi:pseudouridine kinase
MLTETERALVALLRSDPLLSTADMATRLGSTPAAIRVHLSNLGKKGVILGRGYVLRDEDAAVVIGGANVDIKATSTEPVEPATSNPGRMSSSMGGVGRNIAENLARLGTPTHLLAAVGADAFGERLLRETRAAGVLVDHVLRSTGPTGTYTAILDSNGELVTAVSDMATADELDPTFVRSSRDLIAHASFLVLDGNLRVDVVSVSLDLAGAAHVPVLLDPVSDAKAAVLADALDPTRPVFVVTPNRTELAALTAMPTRTDRQIAAASRALHRRGVVNVWVSLGRRGSVLSSMSTGSDETATMELAALPGAVTDVTGAGDAMIGAFVHAHLAGRPIEDAMRFAHAAAALTIESAETVRADLTATAVDARLTAGQSPTSRSSKK